MAVRRLNAGRPRSTPLATLRQRAKPRMVKVAGSKSAIEELARVRKLSAAQRKADSKRRAAAVKARAASNPRRGQNPDNAYTHWVSSWIRRNKSKLKGKSGLEKLRAAHTAWGNLKRKPTRYIKKIKTASGVRRVKRRAGDQKRMGPAWKRFLKRNGGKGYTMKQLGRAFRKDPGASLPVKATKKPTRKSAPKSKPKAASRAKSRTSKPASRASKPKTASKSKPKAASRAKSRTIKAPKMSEWHDIQRQAAALDVYAAGDSKATLLSKLSSAHAPAHWTQAPTYKQHRDKLLAAKKAGEIDMTYGEIQQAARRAAHLAAANPFGALALTNGIALTNPTLGDLISPAFYWDTLKEDVVPIGMGMSLGAGAHALAAATGVTASIMDNIDWIGSLADENIPVVGPWVQTGLQAATTHAPFTIQGSAVFIGSGLLAGMVGPGTARAFLAGLGTSALAFGTGLDLFNAFTGLLSGVSAEETEAAIANGLALTNGLAYQNMGGLALENGLGGLAYYENMGGWAYENMGGLALEPSYGDGFAYETAPVQAAQLNYGQASSADAYYSGADFSEEEGNALMQGPGAWSQAFGPTPYRPKGDPGNASHLAGQPGHRWGWLIQTVGWDKAREICALKPAKRLKVIQSMRQAALDAWQREAASGSYGDPILFMG